MQYRYMIRMTNGDNQMIRVKQRLDIAKAKQLGALIETLEDEWIDFKYVTKIKEVKPGLVQKHKLENGESITY